MNMPRIMQLFRDNAKRARNFKVEKKTESDEATIYIYDVIGYDWWTDGGITAQNFAKELDGIKAKTVHLRINSPGGDVFEARAMVAAMDRHPATFIAHIDGLAASAASFLAVNADEVEMAPGSMLMIHNAWTIAVGDRNDMSKTAALLEKIDDTIAADYAARSGKKVDDIKQLMDDETWFTADEAVAEGFADRVAADAGESATAKNQAWNLSAYEHAPTPKQPKAKPATAPTTAPTTEEVDNHFQNLERRFRVLELTSA